MAFLKCLKKFFQQRICEGYRHQDQLLCQFTKSQEKWWWYSNQDLHCRLGKTRWMKFMLCLGCTS